ncbi:hypothetical protein GCM10010317_096880 [Streptomyces mirabilis]|nr:hypothetical protein GCM10010317_096880 [Streptomyces mirabilis]
MVAGGQAEGGDFEGDTADPEGCAGRQIEQFGRLARAHQHGGQVSGDSDVARYPAAVAVNSPVASTVPVPESTAAT